MSQKRNISNDGQALTTPDLQRISDVAAFADDRALDGMLELGSISGKSILPLKGETSSRGTPLTVCDTNGANAQLLVYECLLVVSSSTPGKVAVSKRLARTASPTFSANSGGTRTDLLYAKVQRVVSDTGPRVIKSTSDGSTAVNPSINVADDVSVTLLIAENVSKANPSASLPADDDGGALGEEWGTYYFPIVTVDIPNGFTSTSQISRASIVQAYEREWLATTRSHIVTLASNTVSTLETESLDMHFASSHRWGGMRQFVSIMALKPGTNSTVKGSESVGLSVVDKTIDWRYRLIYGFAGYLCRGSQAFSIGVSGLNHVYPSIDPAGGPTESGGSAYDPSALPHSVTSGFLGMCVTLEGTSGFGCDLKLPQYSDGVATAGPVYFSVDTNGYLRVTRGPTLLDPTNGDVIALVLFASDQMNLNV